MKQTLIKGAALLAGITALEIFRELHTFRTVHYQVRSGKIPARQELTLVFLSDLHNHVYGKDNRPLVEAVRREQPDLILTGGDMLTGKPGVSWAPAANLLRELVRTAPVYCGNGNHEQRMHEEPGRYGDAYDRYRETLERAGIPVLVNQSISLEVKGIPLCITSVEMPKSCYWRHHPHQMTLEELEERAGQADRERFQILLAHQPDFVEQYLKWGADLVLSGHHHGGIVRIPGVGAVLSPQLKPFPRYSGGFYREKGGQYVAVSRGLGTHTVNLRLFNPAEVVVLHLGGKDVREV